MLSAKPPAALGLWSIPLPTVIDTILKALAPAIPDKVPAAHKGDMGGCSFFGFRKDDGSRFLLLNIFGGGWGGRPDEDGESASVSICQGDVRNTPIELQEIKYPFLIEQHSLRADSGGPGRPSRRPRRTPDLSLSAGVQGEHQSGADHHAALGPAWPDTRAHQSCHHHTAERRRDVGLQGDGIETASGRPRRVLDRGWRRLW
jgi:hypothetical protein